MNCSVVVAQCRLSCCSRIDDSIERVFEMAKRKTKAKARKSSSKSRGRRRTAKKASVRRTSRRAARKSRRPARKPAARRRKAPQPKAPTADVLMAHTAAPGITEGVPMPPEPVAASWKGTEGQ